MYDLLILILLYISGVVLVVVMIAVGVAWGIRWGGTWLLKEVSRDPELEEWLKRILNR